MIICNRDDFEEMKSKIKDGVLADSLFFDTDIYEDLSDVLVTGFVYINSKISNVNYILSKIEGSFTIEPEISFAELEHDIYFDNIKVDNLLTTKGMSHLHLIYEIIPELKPIAVASVRFYLSDNFDDDTIEYLPLSVINATRVNEKILIPSSETVLKLRKLLPESALSEYLKSENFNPITDIFATDIGLEEHYAYVYAANNINDALLETI